MWIARQSLYPHYGSRYPQVPKLFGIPKRHELTDSVRASPPRHLRTLLPAALDYDDESGTWDTRVRSLDVRVATVPHANARWSSVCIRCRNNLHQKLTGIPAVFTGRLVSGPVRPSNGLTIGGSFVKLALVGLLVFPALALCLEHLQTASQLRCSWHADMTALLALGSEYLYRPCCPYPLDNWSSGRVLTTLQEGGPPIPRVSRRDTLVRVFDILS